MRNTLISICTLMTVILNCPAQEMAMSILVTNNTHAAWTLSSRDGVRITYKTRQDGETFRPVWHASNERDAAARAAALKEAETLMNRMVNTGSFVQINIRMRFLAETGHSF